MSTVSIAVGINNESWFYLGFHLFDIAATKEKLLNFIAMTLILIIIYSFLKKSDLHYYDITKKSSLNSKRKKSCDKYI